MNVVSRTIAEIKARRARAEELREGGTSFYEDRDFVPIINEVWADLDTLIAEVERLRAAAQASVRASPPMSLDVVATGGGKATTETKK